MLPNYYWRLRNLPVIVLARAVDARKWLFVEEDLEPVARRDGIHDLHHENVLVCSHIGEREDGRELVLGRGHLVVLAENGDPEFPQLRLFILCFSNIYNNLFWC